MLDLLKAAARFGTRTDSTALPDRILSFTLEYAASPDLNAERAKLATILEGDGFDLFPYSAEDDPLLLILQFVGVEREQSPDFLFSAANELNEILGTVSITPDIDPPYSDIATEPPETEGLGGLLWALCRSNAAGLSDPAWARELMKVHLAEARFGVSGHGILIGQPDTGVAEHTELQSGIDKTRGHNFIDDTADPTDPLSSSMKSPGHGTGTSSAVASRTSNKVTGTASGATLVPIRALNSVVIGSGVAVAKAIDHARAQGCRVITMSLGGPFAGRALRRAIARAAQADMIVLAAAGNCVGQVTYPAWDRNVIAVAGVDHQKNRWKGSCRGSSVDISAPGENVHVARRNAVPTGHQPTPAELADVNDHGQGTSFAVALTAGVAALWLERFGFQAVRTEARIRGMVVQDLFRHALKSTAEVPPDWDHQNMGAGIADAFALLDTPLSALPVAPASVESGNPALLAFGSEFEGEMIESEASFVAFDWNMRQDPEAGTVLERAVLATPSAALANRIAAVVPPGLPAPAAIVAPASPPVPLEEALQRVAAAQVHGLESADSFSTEEALESIKTAGTETILGRAKEALDARAVAEPDKVEPDLQREALSEIRRALQSLSDEVEDPGISLPARRVALEALVRLTGRPAIRVHADGSEVTDPRLGDWRGTLVGTRHKWQRLTDAVGRIDIQLADGAWVHAGTGFVLTDGHVMTNRHVLDIFAEPIPAAAGAQRFVLSRRASIIFDPEASNPATRYDITEVITAGRSRIGNFVDLSKLDMAVVAFDPDNGHGPPPRPIDRSVASTREADLTDILLAGYPAKPRGEHGPASTHQDFLAFWDRITELYGEDYGVKYMSPGKVLKRPGQVVGDSHGWAFTHDATTLAGNSGSGIIALHGGMEFCGLHFGGAALTRNFAHDIDAVFAGGDGIFSTDFLGG